MKFFKSFDDIKPGDVGIDLRAGNFFKVEAKSTLVEWEKLKDYDDGEVFESELLTLYEDPIGEFNPGLLAIDESSMRPGQPHHKIVLHNHPDSLYTNNYAVYRLQPLIKAIRISVIILSLLLIFLLGAVIFTAAVVLLVCLVIIMIPILTLTFGNYVLKKIYGLFNRS